MNIVKYNHHGVDVSVFDNLKGKHREHCLCFQQCKFFKPDTPENCTIAQANFKNCVRWSIVTPVYECPVYEKE